MSPVRFAAAAMAMLKSGSAYIDARIGKRAPLTSQTLNKKRKRKEQRMSKRINRK